MALQGEMATACMSSSMLPTTRTAKQAIIASHDKHGTPLNYFTTRLKLTVSVMAAPVAGW